MIRQQKHTRKELAFKLGISVSSLYYQSKKIVRDWELKNKIEGVLSKHPSYGYRRVAVELKINKKKAQQIMRLFGLKAYRRRGRKYRKTKVKPDAYYPNLLKEIRPQYPDHIWAADFTEIAWHKTKLFLATIIDLYTREIVGFALMNNHATSLIVQALFVALHRHGKPVIFHSDNGREYISRIFVNTLIGLGVKVSRSHPGSPWENGYQEGFYSQFKIDLGDPNRFKTLGELVYEINRLIYDYNHSRIHSILKMSPQLFAQRYYQLIQKHS